jgi:hypothetical protein
VIFVQSKRDGLLQYQSSCVELPMYTESPPLAGRASSDRLHRLTPHTYRPSSFKNAQFARNKPLTTGPIYRPLARFSVAVLIGVGGTLAWQFYGGEMVRAWAPSVAWLLPASPPGPAVTSAELQAQLKPVALELAIMRRSVEQLATNQDQLARKEDQMTQAIAIVQSAGRTSVRKS